MGEATGVSKGASVARLLLWATLLPFKERWLGAREGRLKIIDAARVLLRGATHIHSHTHTRARVRAVNRNILNSTLTHIHTDNYTPTHTHTNTLAYNPPSPHSQTQSVESRAGAGRASGEARLAKPKYRRASL